MRITILEGVTGQGMKKVKEYLPRTQLNTEDLKIFCDSNILFDKRIYSSFGLSLKYIKLQRTLSYILQNYEIYEKAHRCREIYDTFQIFGSLLKAETLREINLAGLFPTADNLLLLERKYADLLMEQDMTGIYKEKIRKKIRLKDFISSTTNTNTYSNNSNTINSSKRINSYSDDKTQPNKKEIKSKVHLSKSQINLNSKNSNLYGDNDSIKDIHKLRFKQKTDSKNEIYENYLKERKLKHISKSQIWESNLKHIENIKKQIPIVKRFCQPCPEGEGVVENPGDILLCPVKKNYFEALTKKMRERYLKDTKHYYSYSNYSLALSFPMIERERNQKYLDYVENKKKWFNEKDFDRYKQPEREKFFFPKINNVL